MAANPEKKANNGSQVLRIGMTKDGRFLAALIPDIPQRKAINREWILAAIKQKGFSSLYLLNDSIDKFVELYNSGRPVKRAIPLAERRDAKVTVSYSDDKMQAYISMQPPYGGKQFTAAELKNLLFEHDVKHGILDDTLAKLAQTQTAEKEVVAEGTAPVPGEDTKFVSLTGEIKERQPKILENGMTDYRDFGEIVTIKAGTQLMRRIPATHGKKGRDIFAVPIDAEPGTDIPFANAMSGVKIHDQNPNILVATITGQPILMPNGAHVENVMDLDNVDLSTGNIIFDGSIHVRGDIATAMKIEVTGDVIVDGMVEAATVTAGGDIIVKGTIIGHGEIRNQIGQLNEGVSVIKAKGSIQAKLAESVILIAGNRILLKEQASRCELDATNEIIVGGKGTKLGQFMGGRARTGILFRAAIIGSQAGIKTCIEISVDDSVHQRLRVLEEEIIELTTEHQRITATWNRMKLGTDTPKEALARTLEKRTAIDIKLARLNNEKEKLKTQVSRVYNGRVVADNTVHPGTTMRIAFASKTFNEEQKGRSFKLDNKDII